VVASASVGALMFSPAIGQQPSLLSQRHDPTRHYRFIECRPRNPIITGKGNHLLDVRVRVVPELDRIWKIEGAPHSHAALENGIGTSSRDRRGLDTCIKYMQREMELRR
jgi:hypothetical protein